jgi:hypothetical protein
MKVVPVCSDPFFLYDDESGIMIAGDIVKVKDATYLIASHIGWFTAQGKKV